jgi:predicted MPP superfamily phosphohydrolase
MSQVLVWLALALAALGHGLLWTSLVNRLHGWAGPRRLINALTLACGVALVAVPTAIALRLATGDVPLAEQLTSPHGPAPYLWLCAAIGAAGLVLKPLAERRREDPTVLLECRRERRRLPADAADRPLIGGFARALGKLPGNEALQLSIDRKRLALPRLPAELEGLTLVHLSDLHMTGRVCEAYFRFLADQVNKLRPDVIAITGDIIEHESCWPWLAESLGRLCAPLGVYFILGNHDAFIDADRTRTLLTDAGLTCVSGRWLRADWNGAPILIGGNELPWMPPAPGALDVPSRGAGDEFRLALCHTPDQFAWCVDADVDLALAGHTHGGQVQLPILGVVASPSLYGARYACGVFRRGDTVLHVTRGVGGETPLRFRCPPEAALLELTRRVL